MRDLGERSAAAAAMSMSAWALKARRAPAREAPNDTRVAMSVSDTFAPLGDAESVVKFTASFGADTGRPAATTTGGGGGGGAGEGRGSEPEVCDATKPTRACRSVPNEVANETEMSHAEQQRLAAPEHVLLRDPSCSREGDPFEGARSNRNCCTAKLAAGAAVGKRFHVR